MTDTQQFGPAGRLLLWILGAALFFVIAFLPYGMYMRYAADATVLLTVQMTAGAILLLLWLATVYGPLRTGPLYDTAHTPSETADREPASLVSRIFFFAIQILFIPFVIILLVGVLAGLS